MTTQPQPETVALGKALRAARGLWTQRAAGKAAGLNHTTISKFEHGADLPGPASLRRLAKVYGVPVESLEALRRAAKPCCREARAEAFAEIRRGVETDAAAAAAHDAWYNEKRRRLAAGGFADSWLSESGEEQLVPWAELSEPVRDFDRIVVRAAVLALLSAPPRRPSGEPEPGGAQTAAARRRGWDAALAAVDRAFLDEWANEPAAFTFESLDQIRAILARLTPERPAGEAGT